MIGLEDQKALLPAILEARAKFYSKKEAENHQQGLSRTTPRNPVASNPNIECPREMVLGMTRPQDVPLKDVHSRARLEHATEDGKRVKRLMEEWGLDVRDVETSLKVTDRKGRIAYTGRIDFAVAWKGVLVPCEVKAYHPSIHGKIETFDDFERSVWTRKGRRQMLIYLLGRGVNFGFFALYCLGDLKLIPVVLDEHLDEAEKAMTAAETANDHRDAGTLPDYTRDPAECRRCWAFGVACNPNIREMGARIIADAEFEQMLRDREAVKDAAKAYEALDKEVKTILKAAKLDLAVCGEFMITRKEIPVKAETTPRPARLDQRFTITKIDVRERSEVA